MNETLNRLGRRVSTGQRATLAEVWEILGPDMSDIEKRRWLIVPDDQGFNRLARIAMGEGKSVVREAHGRMLVAS